MAPFGIYLHWPFCASKCPYCDFNSHVAKTEIDQMAYAKAFAREMAFMRARTGARMVTSIFFGGGTPSLMQASTVEYLLNAIAKYWTIASNAEITLEANPSTVEKERFLAYKAAGVNRLSLGIQALDPEALKALGRTHSVEEAMSALALGREIFERFSFDMIYARAGQKLKDWEKELGQALQYAADHLSLYQLTIEQGTRYYQLYHQGKLSIPEGEEAALFYEKTEQMVERHGFSGYEISNYAKKGAESQHNLLYWRYQEYAGFGPGAHGRFLEKEKAGDRTVTIAEKKPARWLELVEKNGHGIAQEERLNLQEQADEMLLLGLRLKEGLNLQALRALGTPPLPVKTVQQLQEQGLLEKECSHYLKVTPKGRLLLNHVIAQLAC